MCFQVPLALATGVKVGGAVLNALQQRSAAEYSAALADREATTAMQKASHEAGLLREQGRDGASKALAGFGKAGVDPGASGSAAAVIGQTARIVERDALAALHSGRLAADSAKAQAARARARGRQAIAAGAISAGSTLLTGFSRAGGGSGYRPPVDLLG